MNMNQNSDELDRNWQNSAQGQMGSMKKDAKRKLFIRDFLRNKDVAPWFRGTSIFHLQGSNQLFNAIHDDIEQRTTHRVKYCLHMIGLEPMVSSKDLKCLLQLSRGNDLAFLWFLMEMCYKSPNQSKYNLNEQLICSAICHLDMITTLRELDKIVPKVCGGKTVSKPFPKQPQLFSRNSRSKYELKNGATVCKLPYFEKMKRPQRREHDFNAGRRVAYAVIRNAIASIFDDLGAAKLEPGTLRMLCSYHKNLKQIEERYIRQFKIKTRERCLKRSFDNAAAIAKQRGCRINDYLQCEIDKQLFSFRSQTAKIRKEFTLSTIVNNCDQVALSAGEDGNSGNVLMDATMTEPYGDLGCDECNMSIHDLIAKDVHLSKTVFENLKHSQLNDTHVNLLMSGKSTSQMSIFTAKHLHAVDIIGPSQSFFNASSYNKPYQFDYRKIFHCNQKDNAFLKEDSQKLRIAFIEALDMDISYLNELQNAASNLIIGVGECASQIWKSKLKEYKSEQVYRNASEASKQPPPVNAEDKNVLDKMLAKAFQSMRRNPKFVLAQLPEAHKLPMLREWIARRFGKVYSPKDRRTSYRYSLKIFHALDRMSFDFPTPTADRLGNNQFVDYNCKKYLAKKIKHIKERFWRRLDNAIMKQSRTYWFAMRGYLCSGPGPPRQTFFAYMPSRLRDIQRFRPWKFSEHRPDKAERDKRRL
ncbi:uncharacterized protein LOC106086511 isoform X2 [Stomoxys calcitrans]|uniref:uncharacterized protein LOC106086511 isoform X2 n=1 Tax=Stomoxys calcitrans TaxID=35570 RepID=UPI0027E23AE0|nr:uncharacterized protein LOC106086511 isoform X2 [Stomoxys calcitrans]